MTPPMIRFRRLEHGAGLPLPTYATSGSAGMDICAGVLEVEKLTINPGEWALVPSGFEIAVPYGFEAQVRPRSGLAFRYGITCLNSPGTIDADYRGELKVLLVNHGSEAFEITRGMRIAQLVVAPVSAPLVEEVDHMDDTERGPSGFGSTGV